MANKVETETEPKPVQVSDQSVLPESRKLSREEKILGKTLTGNARLTEEELDAVNIRKGLLQLRSTKNINVEKALVKLRYEQELV